MAEADASKVMHAISDPLCLALRPKMDEREELLELVMPLEDAPEGDELAMSVQRRHTLN